MKKTVFILRGLPGTGKSAVARQLKKHFYISVRNYLPKEDKYKADPHLTPKAKEQLVNHYLAALDDTEFKISTIVVEGIHSRLLQLQFFIEEAKQRGYNVFIIHVERSLDECLKHANSEAAKDILELYRYWEPFAGAV